MNLKPGLCQTILPMHWIDCISTLQKDNISVWINHSYEKDFHTYFKGLKKPLLSQSGRGVDHKWETVDCGILYVQTGHTLQWKSKEVEKIQKEN